MKIADAIKENALSIEEPEFYFKVQFLARDAAVEHSLVIYKFFMCTPGRKGGNFFNFEIPKEVPSKETLKKLKYIYQLVTKEWVTLELIVETVSVVEKQPILLIVDTVLST